MAVCVTQSVTAVPVMLEKVSMQLSYLLANPEVVFSIAYVTIKGNILLYPQQFIAVFGWLVGLYMSNPFYVAAFFALLLGVLRDSGNSPQLTVSDRIIALATMLLYIVWVFGGA
jgi:uncharacterized membrane protein